ncbi:MAG TPA: hypothetical protein VF864_02915 [Gemmatimonadales bacterium]
MDATALDKEIRSRGYWRVNIRPSVFIAERAALRDLEAIARDAVVQLRGWDYPHFPRDGVTRGNDFIEAATEAAFISHLEVWRLYQSGQFIHVFSMREDWVEGTPLPGLGNVKPGELLSLESTLYTITEIFLFAARLAQRMALGPEIVVEYGLFGLANRRLETFNPERDSLFLTHGKANTPSFERTVTEKAERIGARAPEIALEQTLKLYERFGWDPPKESVQEEQRRFVERRLR